LFASSFSDLDARRSSPNTMYCRLKACSSRPTVDLDASGASLEAFSGAWTELASTAAFNEARTGKQSPCVISIRHPQEGVIQRFRGKRCRYCRLRL
jgi:hypothetical protein